MEHPLNCFKCPAICTPLSESISLQRKLQHLQIGLIFISGVWKLQYEDERKSETKLAYVIVIDGWHNPVDYTVRGRRSGVLVISRILSYIENIELCENWPLRLSNSLDWIEKLIEDPTGIFDDIIRHASRCRSWTLFEVFRLRNNKNI